MVLHSDGLLISINVGRLTFLKKYFFEPPTNTPYFYVLLGSDIGTFERLSLLQTVTGIPLILCTRVPGGTAEYLGCAP